MSGVVSHKLVSYLEPLFDPSRLATTLDAARSTLGDKEFDTIVGTGLSGSLFAFALAHAMHKNLLIIRKKGDNSHSAYSTEGTLGRRWLFVDDLTDSGKTRDTVIRAVAALAKNKEVEYAGDYFYSWDEFRYGSSYDRNTWDESRKAFTATEDK